MTLGTTNTGASRSGLAKSTLTVGSRANGRPLGDRFRAAVLLTGDAVALALCGGIVAAAFYQHDPGVLRVLLFASAAAMGFLVAAGLYPGTRLVWHEVLRRRVLSMAAAALVAFAAAYLFLDRPSAAAVVLLVLPAGLALQMFVGGLLMHLLRRAGLWATEVDVLGSPSRVSAVAAQLAADWRLGLVPGQSGRSRIAVLADADLPRGEGLAELRQRYDRIVILADTPWMKSGGLQPSDLGGRVALDLPGLTAEGRGAAAVRRLRDITVAALGLIFAAPILLLSAAAIWIIDPGPVLFRHTREGLGGRPLRVWKLRTMYRDADRMLAELLASDPEANREWNTHFKLRRDPRLLPGIGPFLRASSLDELPQLFNVIAGDMTLVGPRPFPAYHPEAMRPEFRAKRATVVPGLTGLWQVSERSDADIGQQQNLDEFYIDNRSAWFDAAIILATTRAVLRRTGA